MEILENVDRLSWTQINRKIINKFVSINLTDEILRPQTNN